MTDESKIIDDIKMMGHTFQVIEEKNELEIYIDGEHIDCFHMLALALKAKNEDSAWLILKNASILYHHRGDVVFNELYEATIEKSQEILILKKNFIIKIYLKRRRNSLDMERLSVTKTILSTSQMRG